jgi:hypothetical protein
VCNATAQEEATAKTSQGEETYEIHWKGKELVYFIRVTVCACYQSFAALGTGPHFSTLF